MRRVLMSLPALVLVFVVAVADAQQPPAPPNRPPAGAAVAIQPGRAPRDVPPALPQTPTAAAPSACQGGPVKTSIAVDKARLPESRGPAEHRAGLNQHPTTSPTQSVRQDMGQGCDVTFEVVRDASVKTFDPTTPCTIEVVTTNGKQGLETDVQRRGDCDGVGMSTSMNMPPPAGRPTAPAGPAGTPSSLAVETTPHRDARIIGWDVFDYPMWIDYVDAQF